MPPKDEIALAQAIQTLLNHLDQAKDWGENGRRRVKDNFTIDKMAQSTLELYQQALKE